MKKVKIMLLAIVVLGATAGTLAFKVTKKHGLYCIVNGATVSANAPAQMCVTWTNTFKTTTINRWILATPTDVPEDCPFLNCPPLRLTSDL